MAVELRFDPAFVEEAVFLELRRLRSAGHGEVASSFHREREAVYELPDAQQRDIAFQQLAHCTFEALGLAELFTARLSEFPHVVAHVELLVVRRVWNNKDEQVELYIGQPGDARLTLHVSTTLFIGLQAMRCLDRGKLTAFLRHELMHVDDMLDPAFAYEPHPAFGGECETEHDLIRERFRLLWNVWVASRMRRHDWPLPEAEQHRRKLDRAFASWQPRRREAVLQDLGSLDRCTQRELLDLAKDERLTRMLGAGGVRCPLCHFPTRDGVRAWDGEWAPVAQAIQADYPDWTPAHGACVQCAELYRTRLYAVHG